MKQRPIGQYRRSKAQYATEGIHPMPNAEQKITQYLQEAHASETGLVRDLEAQIAMTPDGRYRKGLEQHLKETHTHAERLEKRIGELGQGGNPVLAGLGAVESLSAQWLALAKAPFDLLRGSGGEEKVLKNAKESAAAEALEIATYTAIERLAREAGDQETARLAASIREDEQRMLDLVLAEIPSLAEAVAKADINGRSSYRLGDTGAGQSVREIGRQAQEAATGAARRTARAATPKRSETPRRASSRSAPKRASSRSKPAAQGAAASSAPAAKRSTGTRRSTGAKRSTAATGNRSAKRATPARRTTRAQEPAAATPPADLPISGYESLTAEEAVGRLRQLSQAELARLRDYERGAESRQTILERIDALVEDEPWTGYDAQTVEEIRTALAGADEDRRKAVREYERRHKERAGVIDATEQQQPANA
jgi:ferritin-like metal-binding protein YciE